MPLPHNFNQFIEEALDVSMRETKAYAANTPGGVLRGYQPEEHTEAERAEINADLSHNKFNDEQLRTRHRKILEQIFSQTGARPIVERKPIMTMVAGAIGCSNALIKQGPLTEAHNVFSYDIGTDIMARLPEYKEGGEHRIAHPKTRSEICGLDNAAIFLAQKLKYDLQMVYTMTTPPNSPTYREVLGNFAQFHERGYICHIIGYGLDGDDAWKVAQGNPGNKASEAVIRQSAVDFAGTIREISKGHHVERIELLDKDRKPIFREQGNDTQVDIPGYAKFLSTAGISLAHALPTQSRGFIAQGRS